jgi:hypothetical protein
MQSSGNSALLSEELRQSLIDIGYLQDRLVIAIEMILEIVSREISERNKYTTEDNDFYQSHGIVTDKNILIKALLHQHNRLDEMEDLADGMEGPGALIKQKSKEALLFLEQQ